MEKKGGQLVNETLNPPAYLRGGKSGNSKNGLGQRSSLNSGSFS